MYLGVALAKAADEDASVEAEDEVIDEGEETPTTEDEPVSSPSHLRLLDHYCLTILE